MLYRPFLGLEKSSRVRPAGPLRVLFLTTSMPVGGAETLLVNLVRRLDHSRFAAELVCLKQPGPLGELLADEIPVHSKLLCHKYDLRVIYRLARLLRRRRADAVVTVGAGDKMFWGRLAGWMAGTPVIVSALHSTGWPDAVGRLNRLLTPLTHAFIGVAEQHGRHLVEQEGFPAHKVWVIPNGVDVERFQPDQPPRDQARQKLGLPLSAPVYGAVAALRPEKNLSLMLHAAALVRRQLPQAHLVIVGDGPLRGRLEREAQQHGLNGHVHFLGQRSDIQDILPAWDCFVLTSDNEANPVSILEAMSAGLPVVATRVGSIPESVAEGVSGWLVEPGDAEAVAARCLGLLRDRQLARRMGRAGRDQVLQLWSLRQMVKGYEDLLSGLYDRQCRGQALSPPAAVNMAGNAPVR